MTAAGDATLRDEPTTSGQVSPAVDSPDAPQPDSDPKPAGWPIRAGAFAIDMLPGAWVLAVAALVSMTVPLWGPWWWVCVAVGGLALVLMTVNRVILAAATGASLGRIALGATVVRSDGTAAGPRRLLVRDLAHLLDTGSLLIGWLWPLWDRRRRTFADLLVKTEVRRTPARWSELARRRWCAAMAAVALVCAAGAAVSYLVTYRPDRAGTQARSQLQAQGPNIVADILSFDPKTLADDFARAQALTTDNYRPELIAVQQQVQRAPTPHRYWVANSAVLCATTTRGAMLMFLQGQVGDAANIFPGTASVRVGFVKSAGRWLVDELIFVSASKPSGTCS